MICLPKEVTQKFLAAIKDGTLDPGKLAQMESLERRGEFEKIVGGDAKEINALFEKKLLMKHQQDAMIAFVKEASGMKTPASRELLDRVSKMDKYLNPKEEEAFLHDLVAKKLGTEVDQAGAKEIIDLSSDAMKAREAFAEAPTKANQIAYGEKVRQFLDHTDNLSAHSAQDRVISVANFIGKTWSVIGDLGWGFRQGWGLQSHLELWKGMAKQFHYLVSEGKYHELQAQILGDPDYKLMKKGGLRLPAVSKGLSGREEEFMSDVTKKIPVLSNIERAQQGEATYVRYWVAKKMLNASRLAGNDVRAGSNEVRSIMNTVNNFSGSGNIGIDDQFANMGPVLNPILFSARKISATVNAVPSIFSPTISTTVRIARVRNLIGSTVLTAGYLYALKAAGVEVGLDPNASNFGHVVVGKHHIDLTGGNASYATLLSRLIQNKTTSATGKETQLGKGYKPETRGSITLAFMRNKLAPVAGIVADWFFGPNPLNDPQAAKLLFGDLGKKPTFDAKREALKTMEPMFIDTILQGIYEDKDNMLLPTLMDYFGAGDNIY